MTIDNEQLTIKESLRDDLRQHRTIRQEPVARDFSSAESLENRGILGVFPVFQTARMGEKTRHPAADDLCGVALEFHNSLLPFQPGYHIIDK